MLTKAKVYPQIWNLYRGQVCKYNCHVCHFWCRKKTTNSSVYYTIQSNNNRTLYITTSSLAPV